LSDDLAAPAGVLALGFADSPEGARALARSCLGEGFDAVKSLLCGGPGGLGGGSSHPRSAQRSSARGLSLGYGTENPRRKDLSWRRDCQPDHSLGKHKRQSWRLSPGMDAGRCRGRIGAPRGRLHRGCEARARPWDRHPARRWRLESEQLPRPTVLDGLQLDEVGFPILLAAKLAEYGAVDVTWTAFQRWSGALPLI
jgi:glucoamylase